MSNVSLNIGLDALLTAQTALDTVGHNISNANTPGYSRQSVSLTPARSMQLRGLEIGTGVDTETIQRTVDQLLNRRLFGQVSVTERLSSRLTALSDLESILGEPGGVGVSALLDDMFTKVAELSTAPTDSVARAAVVNSADSLANQLRSLGSELDRLRVDTKQRTRSLVDEVNSLAANVVELNQQIVATEGFGSQANDLRDRRDTVIREISERLEVQVVQASNGSAQLLIDGQLLVGAESISRLQVEDGPNDSLELSFVGAPRPLTVESGRIGGLVSVFQEALPSMRSDLDQLARNLVLEVNRIHSTGVPTGGGFDLLVADTRIEDINGDGGFAKVKLVDVGGPFQVRAGELFVHVVEEQSGAITTHRIAVDPAKMSVGDLLGDISAIDELSATVDSLGRVQILASDGHRFDFSRRMDPAPAAAGTFGGRQASLGTADSGPFALVPGDTLVLDNGTGPFTIAFQPSDFVNASAATAEEIAAVINSNSDAILAGLRAVPVGEGFALQSVAGGAGESFDVVGGSALAAFGWSAGTTVTGQDTPVVVEISGAYSADENARFTFRAAADGEIGSTPNLDIEVIDMDGRLVTTIDVGAGYVPGTKIDLLDGISVSFSLGRISATDNDAFKVDALADSDTSDVLVALGLNSFFTGRDADTIGVATRLLEDPSLLASSADGDAGDNRALLDLVDLQAREIEGLEASIGNFYANVVGDVGLRIQTSERASEIEGQRLESLEARRDQVSGVSLDEELVDLIRFEQSFGAASRFIQIVNSLQDEILNIL